MCVFPVLLLLMRLMAAVTGGANESASGNASGPQVNTTVLSQIKNNNLTVAATTTTTSTSIAPSSTNETMGLQMNDKDKQDKVIATTVQAATSAKPTTASTVTTVTKQTPQAMNSTANSTQITDPQTKTPPKLDKPLTEAGVSQSDISNNKGNSDSNNNNNNNSSGSKSTPAGIGTGSKKLFHDQHHHDENSNSGNLNINNDHDHNHDDHNDHDNNSTSLKAQKTITTDHQVPGENNQLNTSAVINGDSVDASIKSDPISESVREMVSRPNHDENEYIVPIVAVMLTVPIAFAVFIIMYRRFRDLWTTRHYRRMDFLVDGMYND